MLSKQLKQRFGSCLYMYPTSFRHLGSSSQRPQFQNGQVAKILEQGDRRANAHLRATGQRQPGRQTSVKYGILVCSKADQYGTLVISMQAAMLNVVQYTVSGSKADYNRAPLVQEAARLSRRLCALVVCRIGRPPLIPSTYLILMKP